MNVSKSALVDIMVGLGFPNAGNWSDDKMMEKVHQKLPVAFVTSKNLFSKEGLELAKTIVAAKRNGDTISITSDKAGKSEAKPKKTGKGKPPVSKKDKKEKKSKNDKKEKKAKKSSGGGQKRPGIIAYIKEIMEGTSKNKRLTPAEVIKMVCKKFKGETNPDSAKNTVTSQLSCQLRAKGFNVVRHEEGGYYLKTKK